MARPAQQRCRAWIAFFAVTAISLAAIVSIAVARYTRAQFVSRLPEWSVEIPRADPSSSTGYLNGVRRLIIPGLSDEGYRWISETQQLAAGQDPKIRDRDHGNLSTVRNRYNTSPYRWWLILLATIDHGLAGRSIGLAVEDAAFYTGPILQLILLVSCAGLVAWRIGPGTAALVTIGIAGLFPFTNSYESGAPTDASLFEFFFLWSFLFIAIGATGESARKTRAVFFILAVATASLALWISVPFTEAFYDHRLDIVDGSIGAGAFSWLRSEGLNLVTFSTLAPIVCIICGVLLTLWKHPPDISIKLACILGPLAVSLFFAWRHFWWWNLVDVSVIASLVPLSSILSAHSFSATTQKAGWIVAAIVLSSGGLYQWKRSIAHTPNALTSIEADAYLERDLAEWLATHVQKSDAVILCPPGIAPALSFHGGLREIASLDSENANGNNAAMRIVSASTYEEAAALINNRSVTHIVIPSWDSGLEAYAAAGLKASVDSARFKKSFIARLQRWELPPWLRPIPYILPPDAGADRNVVILEVEPEQRPQIALSRLTDYFIEMQQLDRAVAIAQTLHQYPGDINALTALASVKIAVGDHSGASAIVAEMLPFLGHQGNRAMPVDRRLSLAILLAQTKQDALEAVRKVGT